MKQLILLIFAAVFLSFGSPVSARYYEASTARFLQEDPIALPMPTFTDINGVTRGSTSFYQYAYNNPLKYTDPYGLFSTEEQFQAFAQCVAQNRLDPYLALSVLGSALPLKGLFGAAGTFGSTPLTTFPSIAAYYARYSYPDLALFLRYGGRTVSTVLTPLTVFEGYYDIGTILRCVVVARPPENNTCQK